MFIVAISKILFLDDFNDHAKKDNGDQRILLVWDFDVDQISP